MTDYAGTARNAQNITDIPRIPHRPLVSSHDLSPLSIVFSQALGKSDLPLDCFGLSALAMTKYISPVVIKITMSKTSNLLLRIALAFAFLYPAYGMWTNPNDWLGYIPSLVKNIGLSQDILLMLIAGLHLVIALWILSGWKIFFPSLVATVFLGSVVYFNQNQLDVLFRDISLALVAVALAFGAKNRF